MNIWVVNPFDQLPNESDVPLRYWSLCRTFAEQGHSVIWWSSDFAHLSKTKRESCEDVDGFSIRLVKTPAYTKNISLARLRNHKCFAEGFLHDAIAGLESGELNAPDRIIVSLPPLGVAESAFQIRDHLIKIESRKLTVGHTNLTSPCEVVVDIMDAWPEVFYQVLPKPMRKYLGLIVFSTMHRRAKRAYLGADKISGVGQSYLDLAKRYLQSQTKMRKSLTEESPRQKPLYLCYHGTDLSRFDRKNNFDKDTSYQVVSTLNQPINNSIRAIERSQNIPLRAVYLGSMGSGYDLQTIIDTARLWKNENIFPFQIHFAGVGPQLEMLKARCKDLGLLTSTEASGYVTRGKTLDSVSGLAPSISRVVFHGYLRKDAISELLLSAHVALVANRPDSLVACPYKAGEYAAASLPMISCLGGELGQLLEKWKAGTEYLEGNSESLYFAFQRYSNNKTLEQHSSNALDLAEELFDRDRTYLDLAKFILS